MFKFFDRWVENILHQKFAKKREAICFKILTIFKKQHPEICRNNYDELCNRIEKEYLRVYAIVDRSLLRAGIIRAKYTFIATGLSSVLLVGSLGAFSGGSALPFISPLAVAFIAMITSLATIEIAYEQRVKAGYDSVITLFLHETKSDKSATSTLQTMRALFEDQPDAAPLSVQLAVRETPVITAPPADVKAVRWHHNPEETNQEHRIDIGLRC